MPIRQPAEIDVIRAVWGISRYAKRCRGAAEACYDQRAYRFATMWRRRKEKAYRAKGQTLHYLLEEGRLAISGHHRFGHLYAEVLTGEGYSLHRPCPYSADLATVEDLGSIEAKPRRAKEPRLMDCEHTLAQYLAGREVIAVYSWPPRVRHYYYFDDDDDFDDDDFLARENAICRF